MASGGRRCPWTPMLCIEILLFVSRDRQSMTGYELLYSSLPRASVLSNVTFHLQSDLRIGSAKEEIGHPLSLVVANSIQEHGCDFFLRLRWHDPALSAMEKCVSVCAAPLDACPCKTRRHLHTATPSDFQKNKKTNCKMIHHQPFLLTHA